VFILDANVISELWKQDPEPKVIAWTNANVSFLSVPVLAELQEGAEASPSPTRRAEVNARIDELLSECGELILHWDAETARTWGRLQHSPEVKRRPQPLWDSLIDALAVRHGAVVVTRNAQDFRHARTLNPWTGREQRRQ
jgi:toxin FitB